MPGRGVLSWLNLMSVQEGSRKLDRETRKLERGARKHKLGMSLPRLDEANQPWEMEEEEERKLEVRQRTSGLDEGPSRLEKELRLRREDSMTAISWRSAKEASEARDSLSESSERVLCASRDSDRVLNSMSASRDSDRVLNSMSASRDSAIFGMSSSSASRDSAKFQPYIQSDCRHQVVVPDTEPLHLFHTIRNRKHIFHCYEFLLMRKLEEDQELWRKLCERFGHCDQCRAEDEDLEKEYSSPRHTHGTPVKDPFAINSIHQDMWYLAITLKESKDKLIHFIRSELSKREGTVAANPKPLCETFLSNYLSSFNFVELNLDNVFKYGEGSELPRELFRCINVKTLSVRHNFLDRIPSDIGYLSKLERLFLTGNKLQNKSIPFTIAFCRSLTELYIDNNLLDALPGVLLEIGSLERVHRHGNHNYFKATFMWYHTDVNDRILECPGTSSREVEADHRRQPQSLQTLSAMAVITSKLNFYGSSHIPTRIKDYISNICEHLELCSNCSVPRPHSAPGFKVFTFKNPYLGNTCVPFQHWACSRSCAQEVEVPARAEQLTSAREQDRQYERYVRESLSRLRPSQRALSSNNLGSSCTSGRGSQVSLVSRISQDQPNISCGIL